MKRLSLLLALAPLLALAAEPASKQVDTLDDFLPLAAQVSVANLELTLPSDQRELPRTLWDQFATKPEVKAFAGVSSANWEAKWDLLADTLVAKAISLHLDGTQLRKCLDSLTHGRKAPLVSVPIRVGGSTSSQEKPTTNANPPTTIEQSGNCTTDEATIPVGAYLVQNGTTQSWVIVCNYEAIDPALPLCLVRIWAIDATTTRIVSFVDSD